MAEPAAFPHAAVHLRLELRQRVQHLDLGAMDELRDETANGMEPARVDGSEMFSIKGLSAVISSPHLCEGD